MALPRRFRRNVVSNYAVVGCSLIIALVTTPLLARALGPAEFGIWVLVASFVLYLELLDFGFSAATAKYVAGHDANGRPDLVAGTLTTSLYLLCLPGLVALGIGLAIAGVFPTIFDVAPPVRSAAQLLVIVLAIDLAISVPGDTFGAALIGLQRFDLINFTLIAVSVSQALAWALVLYLGGGLVALGAVTAGISLLGQGARFVLARRLVPEISLRPSGFTRSLVRPFAGLSMWFALRDVAQVVRSRIDTVVVGILLGVAAAGIYGVGQKLALIVERMSYPVVTTFFPYSAELMARNDAQGLRSAVLIGTRLSLGIGGPLCLVLGLLAGPALDVWVGPAFADARPVVVYLAAAAAVKIITHTGIVAMGGMGLARGPSLVASGEAALNLLLSVVLGSRMGLSGVALATFLAAVIVELVVMLPMICRSLGMPVIAFVGSLARAHLPPVAAALGVALAIGASQAEGLVELLLAALAIGGAYLLVFFLSGLEPGERKQLRLRVFPTGRPSPTPGPAGEPVAAEDGNSAGEQQKGVH